MVTSKAGALLIDLILLGGLLTAWWVGRKQDTRSGSRRRPDLRLRVGMYRLPPGGRSHSNLLTLSRAGSPSTMNPACQAPRWRGDAHEH